MTDTIGAFLATLLQDPVEVTAVAFGILSVWLSTREHIASWPTAMVNVALFFVVFARARLYADMGLQVVYFGLSAYGWYEWKFGGTGRTELPVGRTTPRTAAWLVSLAIVGTVGLGTYLHRATDAALPYLDSALAVCSLLAQWMMTRKLLENWLAWIVLDVIYVGMFLARGLSLTAVNYAVYLALAVLGYVQWRRSWTARRRPEDALMATPPLRIVVTGPECTGKTTIARALGESLGAPIVPEAARLYAEWHDGALSAATVAPIAQLSIRLEEEALAAVPVGAKRLLVRDTDLMSTVVYARHYYGEAEPWIEQEALARRGDLYLLCATDIPWVPDGIRDRPASRDELYGDFAGTLDRAAARVVVVRGTGAARLESAADAVRTSGLIALRAASS